MSMEQRNPAPPPPPAAAGKKERGSAAERVLSPEARSFRMDRKSPEASRLMASVSNKLYEFLGNYSDDVLAEYIVVLVCNGKNQNQARDDLEAFLGDESGRFVAWLWNHLYEDMFISKPHLDSSNHDAKVTATGDVITKNQHKTCRSTDIQSFSAAISDIPLSKNGKYCESSNFSTDPSRTMQEPDKLQSGIATYSSKMRCPAESSSGGEQCLQYENQAQKIDNSDSNYRRHSSVPKTEPVARSMKSTTTEDIQPRRPPAMNPLKGRLPSTDMDVVPHPSSRPRGNVWDRLGKPSNGNEAYVGKNQYRHDNDVLAQEKMDNNGEGLQNFRLTNVVQETKLFGETTVFDNCSRAISDNLSDQHKILDHNARSISTLDHADNPKRKRRYGDFSSGDCTSSFSERQETYKEVFPKSEGSFPIKSNRLRSLNNSTSESKSTVAITPQRELQSVKSASTQFDSQSDKAPLSQLNRRGSVTYQRHNPLPVGASPAKQEPLTDAKEEKTGHKPVQDEVLNVKSRLRQVEMDMIKLRSKQAEMGIDVKPNPPSGLQNTSEEDIESKTVLVTNVHFAAPKEALLSHFSKCGDVLKVILLTEPVTAQPKGAAYIVFVSKESVDKALAMSGTSFFSRILTVMRKADMPSGFLVPSQLGSKLTPPSYPQPYKKKSVQKSYTSNHLQWRRDQPGGGQTTSVPSTTNGLGPSATGE